MKPVPNPPKSVDSHVSPDLEPSALFHLEIVASSIPLNGKNVSEYFRSLCARARVLFARVSQVCFFPPQGGRSAQRGASPLLRLRRATSDLRAAVLLPPRQFGVGHPCARRVTQAGRPLEHEFQALSCDARTRSRNRPRGSIT